MGARYNSSDRLGFAGVVVGFCLCLAGAVSPYWIAGEVALKSLMSNSTSDATIVVDAGIFWFYYDTLQNGTDSKRTGILSDIEDFDRNIVTVQILAIVSIIISLSCGVVALCRSSCCKNGKPVCHGILAFLAGAAGIALIVLIQQDTELLVEMPLVDSSYRWSFYLYTGGTGALILMSFFLCLSAVGKEPDETIPLAPMRLREEEETKRLSIASD